MKQEKQFLSILAKAVAEVLVADGYLVKECPKCKEHKTDREELGKLIKDAMDSHTGVTADDFAPIGGWLRGRHSPYVPPQTHPYDTQSTGQFKPWSYVEEQRCANDIIHAPANSVPMADITEKDFDELFNRYVGVMLRVYNTQGYRPVEISRAMIKAFLSVLDGADTAVVTLNGQQPTATAIISRHENTLASRQGHEFFEVVGHIAASGMPLYVGAITIDIYQGANRLFSATTGASREGYITTFLVKDVRNAANASTTEVFEEETIYEGPLSDEPQTFVNESQKLIVRDRTLCVPVCLKALRDVFIANGEVATDAEVSVLGHNRSGATVLTCRGFHSGISDSVELLELRTELGELSAYGWLSTTVVFKDEAGEVITIIESPKITPEDVLHPTDVEDVTGDGLNAKVEYDSYDEVMTVSLHGELAYGSEDLTRATIELRGANGELVEEPRDITRRIDYASDGGLTFTTGCMKVIRTHDPDLYKLIVRVHAGASHAVYESELFDGLLTVGDELPITLTLTDEDASYAISDETPAIVEELTTLPHAILQNVKLVTLTNCTALAYTLSELKNHEDFKDLPINYCRVNVEGCKSGENKFHGIESLIIEYDYFDNFNRVKLDSELLSSYDTFRLSVVVCDKVSTIIATGRSEYISRDDALGSDKQQLRVGDASVTVNFDQGTQVFYAVPRSFTGKEESDRLRVGTAHLFAADAETGEVIPLGRGREGVSVKQVYGRIDGLLPAEKLILPTLDIGRKVVLHMVVRAAGDTSGLKAYVSEAFEPSVIMLETQDLALSPKELTAELVARAFTGPEVITAREMDGLLIDVNTDMLEYISSSLSPVESVSVNVIKARNNKYTRTEYATTLMPIVDKTRYHGVAHCGRRLPKGTTVDVELVITLENGAVFRYSGLNTIGTGANLNLESVN